MIRPSNTADRFLIAEVKGAGWAALPKRKRRSPIAGAPRSVPAVNPTGEFGRRDYKLAYAVRDLRTHLDMMTEHAMAGGPATDAGMPSLGASSHPR